MVFDWVLEQSRVELVVPTNDIIAGGLSINPECMVGDGKNRIY